MLKLSSAARRRRHLMLVDITLIRNIQWFVKLTPATKGKPRQSTERLPSIAWRP